MGFSSLPITGQKSDVRTTQDILRDSSSAMKIQLYTQSPMAKPGHFLESRPKPCGTSRRSMGVFSLPCVPHSRGAEKVVLF